MEENNLNQDFKSNENMNKNENSFQSENNYVESNNDKRPDKSKNVIIVILVLIILGLLAFIIYDKCIDKKKTELEPPKTEDSKIESKVNYYKVETIDQVVNGKSNKISFKFYIKNADQPCTSKKMIAYDIFLNEKKILGSYDVFDSESVCEMEISENTNLTSEIEKLKKQVGVLKGDKEYLYIKDYVETPTGAASAIYVYNSSDVQIFTQQLKIAGGMVMLEKTCPNYQEFVEQFRKDENIETDENTAIYFMNASAIYYIASGGREATEAEAEAHKTNFNFIADSLYLYEQYKVEFKDDKAIKTKVGSCFGNNEGAQY